MHRCEGRYELGYLFARRAAEIPFPHEAALFVDGPAYDWRIRDELSICAYYTGRLRESFESASAILDSEEIEEADRERVLANRDFCVPHMLELTSVYPEGPVRQLVERTGSGGDVTFTITSRRRLDLFERTMSSFLHCFTDHGRIARWICVDDGSSAEDLARMQARYPFLEIVVKDRADEGYARSMNVARAMIRTPL